MFSADDFFIPRKLVITEFDVQNFKIKSVGYGESFDISKHPQENILKYLYWKVIFCNVTNNRGSNHYPDDSHHQTVTTTP